VAKACNEITTLTLTGARYLSEYYGVAEPPIRSTLSHCLAQNEPPCRWLSQ